MKFYSIEDVLSHVAKMWRTAISAFGGRFTGGDLEQAPQIWEEKFAVPSPAEWFATMWQLAKATTPHHCGVRLHMLQDARPNPRELARLLLSQTAYDDKLRLHLHVGLSPYMLDLPEPLRPDPVGRAKAKQQQTLWFHFLQRAVYEALKPLVPADGEPLVPRLRKNTEERAVGGGYWEMVNLGSVSKITFSDDGPFPLTTRGKIELPPPPLAMPEDYALRAAQAAQTLTMEDFL